MNRLDVSRLAVWIGVAAAIAAPASQALTGWGLTASQFAGQGDATLRVAGYAFSIWGVIYTGLIAYAVRRAVRKETSALEASLDLPLAVASFGCGLWIVAAGLNLRWLTVLVIAAALVASVVGLVRVRRAAPVLSFGQRVTALWPISLLAGWLTAASVVNVLTVLTSEGVIAPAAAASWALAGIALAAAIAIGVLLAVRFPSYALPVAWGLVGAFVAERNHQPLVANAALGCAGLLLLVAVFVGRTPNRA